MCISVKKITLFADQVSGGFKAVIWAVLGHFRNMTEALSYSYPLFHSTFNTSSTKTS